MRHPRVPSRTAATCLVVMALLATGLTACGGGGGTYPLMAEFPSALNVYAGNAVTTSGAAIGTVEDVRVAGDLVRVTMAIDDRYPVPKDATARVSPRALLGEYEIELTPMWTSGDPRLEAGAVIPRERTAVPATLDETLRSLRDLLTAMEPDTVGRLVDSTAEALQGRGQDVNTALASLSQLADTVAAEDDALGRITEQSDVLTSALARRDQQLGSVIDAFATVSGTLSRERDEIAGLVTGLADLTGDTTDLLVEHRAELEDDVVQATRLLQAADANLEELGYFNYAFRQYAEHIYKGAYREDGDLIASRLTFTPAVFQELEPLLDYVGLESVCVPVPAQQTCRRAPLDLDLTDGQGPLDHLDLPGLGGP